MGMQDRDWYREEMKRKAREMRASREDAPRYVGRKKGAPNLGIAVVIGCAVTAAALVVWSKFQKFEAQEQAVEQSQTHAPKYSFEEPARSAEPTPEERFWAEQNQAKKERQTEFNDSNYTPRGADNVVTSENVQPQREVVRTYTTQKEVVVVGTQRDIGDDACSFYRQGSIERRDCKAEVNLNMRNR